MTFLCLCVIGQQECWDNI